MTSFIVGVAGASSDMDQNPRINKFRKDAL
jgi:hypothetical protein